MSILIKISLLWEINDREPRIAEKHEREENDERSVLVCSTESVPSPAYGSTATETEDQQITNTSHSI